VANILIVEDEHIVAWDIKETLEKLGHTVIDRVVSGAEAIQSAEIEDPDLVLMDIRLEGEIDGIAAGNEIYHQLDIPVVYLTAHADELTLKRATSTNPFGYIVKPFHARSLQSTIQIALQRHELEAATKLAHADLANTLASIGAGIIVTDRQGLVTRMNPIAASLTGWQERVAIGLEIGQVFRLIWESDGMAIENPSLRAMRLNEPIKSPEKCWLVAKDGFELPIYDTATPIANSAGEIVGSIVIFYDNTERILAQMELWEQHNQKLAEFQLKFISHLQQETAEHQQASSCIQVLSQVLNQVRIATNEHEILSFALQALGATLDLDYGWIALHDRQTATARVICDYAIAGRLNLVSAINQQIDLQLYPQFYQQLCQPASWIDPPAAIVPSGYLNLLTPGAKLLICPLVIPAEHNAQDREWTIGEIGIVSTGKPAWTPAQATLIQQIFRSAIELFRQTQLKSAAAPPEQLRPPDSIDLAWEWLDLLNAEFTGAISQADRDLKMSAAMLQRQIRALNVETNDLEIIEQHQFLHRQLLEYLQIVKAEWRQQFDLIDTLIEFESALIPPQNLAINNTDFHQWIDRIVGNCTILARRYHQKLSYEITGQLPSVLICNFPVLESIVMEIFANACIYTPPDQSISIGVNTQANQLTVSVVSSGISISPKQLATIFLPFSHISHHHSSQHSVTGWGLELVTKLLAYLGGDIQAKSDRTSTSLILTVPI
jgi:PAS domain S-box-containing protein